MIGVEAGEKRTIVYGQREVSYRLFFLQRKTIEIAVHPDGRVVVKAPIDTDFSLVEQRVLKRARWIFRQVDYFRQFRPRTPERSYISGETHLYLGRQYRLKIVQGERNKISLSRGCFYVCSTKEPTPERVKALMDKWYLEKAKLCFRKSIERCWPLLKMDEAAKPKVFIRRMKRRWGSLSSRGNLTLNTDLVKAPKDCIDYVVIHELCHLKYPRHGYQFYQLLSALIPEWERIKHRLEVKMA